MRAALKLLVTAENAVQSSLEGRDFRGNRLLDKHDCMRGGPGRRGGAGREHHPQVSGGHAIVGGKNLRLGYAVSIYECAVGTPKIAHNPLQSPALKNDMFAGQSLNVGITKSIRIGASQIVFVQLQKHNLRLSVRSTNGELGPAGLWRLHHDY